MTMISMAVSCGNFPQSKGWWPRRWRTSQCPRKARQRKVRQASKGSRDMACHRPRRLSLFLIIMIALLSSSAMAHETGKPGLLVRMAKVGRYHRRATEDIFAGRLRRDLLDELPLEVHLISQES